MKFRNQEHKDRFYALFEQMTCKDNYHESAAYLLTLDDVLYKHVDEIYDFQQRIINREIINESWQTHTSRKTFRLLRNLWNGTYNDSMALRSESSKYYCPDEIFNSSYAPYYWEAIKLRFPWIICIDEGIADD